MSRTKDGGEGQRSGGEGNQEREGGIGRRWRRPLKGGVIPSKDSREGERGGVRSPEARAGLGGGGGISGEVGGSNAASRCVDIDAGPIIAKVAADVLTRPTPVARSDGHSELRGSRGLCAGVDILSSKAKTEGGGGEGERIRSWSQSMAGNGEGRGREEESAPRFPPPRW